MPQPAFEDLAKVGNDLDPNTALYGTGFIDNYVLPDRPDEAKIPGGPASSSLGYMDDPSLALYNPSSVNDGKIQNRSADIMWHEDMAGSNVNYLHDPYSTDAAFDMSRPTGNAYTATSPITASTNTVPSDLQSQDSHQHGQFVPSAGRFLAKQCPLCPKGPVYHLRCHCDQHQYITHEPWDPIDKCPLRGEGSWSRDEYYVYLLTTQ